MTKGQQYLAGFKEGLAVLFGFIPVGIAYAIVARQAGLTPIETVLMSATGFAGASQMMVAGMYAQGASVAAAIVATFILNLRHLIMSTCVFDRMKNAPLKLKLVAAFGITDESFAMFTTQGEKHSNVYFFLGLITATYSSWVVGTVIGVVASAFLPDMLSASMGIALYAMFLALLTPGVKQNLRLVILVALTAVLNALLSKIIAPSWSLIISTIACAMLGTFFVDLDGKEGESNAA